MSSDVAAIEKVLQVYFDGLHEGDTKKLGEAFHFCNVSLRAFEVVVPAAGSTN